MYQNSQQSPQMPKLSSRDTPLTLVLIAANLVTLLLLLFSPSGRWLVSGMALTEKSVPNVWTVLTWPFLGIGGVIWILLNAMWAWTVGGSMERAWGTPRVTRFFLATTALTGLAVALAIRLLSLRYAAFGSLGMALTPVSVAWCYINRNETIRFQFLFPIPALWIAVIHVLLQFVFTAQMLGNPWAGFAGLAGSAAAWWWVRGGREWSEARFGKKKDTPNLRFADLDKDIRGGKQPRSNPLLKAREERKRKERDDKIAEMFRNSGFKDDD